MNRSGKRKRPAREEFRSCPTSHSFAGRPPRRTPKQSKCRLNRTAYYHFAHAIDKVDRAVPCSMPMSGGCAANFFSWFQALVWEDFRKDCLFGKKTIEMRP